MFNHHIFRSLGYEQPLFPLPDFYADMKPSYDGTPINTGITWTFSGGIWRTDGAGDGDQNVSWVDNISMASDADFYYEVGQVNNSYPYTSGYLLYFSMVAANSPEPLNTAGHWLPTYLSNADHGVSITAAAGGVANRWGNNHVSAAQAGAFPTTLLQNSTEVIGVAVKWRPAGVTEVTLSRILTSGSHVTYNTILCDVPTLAPSGTGHRLGFGTYANRTSPRVNFGDTPFFADLYGGGVPAGYAPGLYNSLFS